jgi:hypothetical protein
MSLHAFSPGEVFGATLLALLVELGFAGAMIFARGDEVPRVQPEPLPLAVKVNPVLDDELPLLKKGGKPNPRKLPDMPKPAKPIERFEENSAPAVSAPKEAPPAPLPSVAKAEETPRPPEAPVVKKADRPPLVVEREEEPNVQEEGAADGVEEGTETDPLKARAISVYKLTLTSWFKRGFSSAGVAGCLRVKVVAHVDAEGTVTSYDIRAASGNAEFDGRVRAHMDGRVGQQVPPPPPNYPELREPTALPTFESDQCK